MTEVSESQRGSTRSWRRDLARAAATAALLTGLAILMTWPLLPNLDRAATDPGDPYVNAFIIDWVASRLANGSVDFFDAPLAYPASNSLAFSEHLIGLGVLALPLHLAGTPPLTAYNVLFLLGIVGSGMGAWLLTWHIGRSHIAATLAAVAYAFLPYRMGQASHIQHVWSPWLPVALWALLLLRERPQMRRAVVLAAAVVMLGLSNIHWLLFGMFALTASALVLAVRRVDRTRFLVMAIGGLLAGGALLLPTLLPYRQAAQEHRMERTAVETLHYSATPFDWLIALGSEIDHEPERSLFPGLILTSGVLVSVLALRSTAARVRFAVMVLMLWMLLGFVGSLGLNAPFHRFLFENVEPFRAIRVPARWAMLSYTGMAVAFGLAALALRHFRPPTRLMVAALVLGALLWETRTFPMRWYLRETQQAAVYNWMRRLPPGGGILELPIGGKTSEYEYTLALTEHRRPIVNGTAATPFQREVIAMANTEPIPDRLVDVLEKADVKIVVVHTDRLGPRESRTIDFLRRNLESGRLLSLGRFMHQYRGDFVFVVPPVARKRDALDDFLARTARSDLRMLDLMAAGTFMQTDDPLGVLDFPPPGYRSEGGLLVSGWAMAPAGIHDVTILFNNGLVAHRAELLPRPDVEEAHPGIPATGFRLELGKRPLEIWPKADVQVKIEDGTGRVTYLPQIWFEWIDANQ